MGYGEVESYEDFANYNEQALNLLTAKFAPVPTWIYPPLQRFWRCLIGTSGITNTIILSRLTMPFLNSNGWN
jgi:hypothetical protein